MNDSEKENFIYKTFKNKNIKNYHIATFSQQISTRDKLSILLYLQLHMYIIRFHSANFDYICLPFKSEIYGRQLHRKTIRTI